MTPKSKKRKTTKRPAPLSRADLLPLAASLARSISLKNHMALAAFKTGHGNLDLARELLKTVCWTFYLSDGRAVAEREEDFILAERSLKASLIEARETGRWEIAESDAIHLEKILRLHDEHLASTPLHQLERAKQRLTRLVQEKEGSPSRAVGHSRNRVA